MAKLEERFLGFTQGLLFALNFHLCYYIPSHHCTFTLLQWCNSSRWMFPAIKDGKALNGIRWFGYTIERTIFFSLVYARFLRVWLMARSCYLIVWNVETPHCLESVGILHRSKLVEAQGSREHNSSRLFVGWPCKNSTRTVADHWRWRGLDRRAWGVMLCIVFPLFSSVAIRKHAWCVHFLDGNSIKDFAVFIIIIKGITSRSL